MSRFNNMKYILLSHDKSFWEGKQRYVDRRNRENMEIDGLTEEQHIAIQYICSMRHDLHTFGAKTLYNSESSDNKEYSRYLFNEEGVRFGDGEIDNLIKENDLPPINWSKEIGHYYLYELPFDEYEYLEEQYEYDKEEYQNGKLNPKIDGNLKKAIEEDLDYDDAQDKYFISEDYYNINIETWSNFLEIANNDIEKWLEEIDRTYGTNYCPTGNARAKLYGSALMSAKIKVYHGTNFKFDKFDKSKIGINTGVSNAIFFTDNKDVASTYGCRITEWELNPNNPITLDFGGKSHCWFFDKELSPTELVNAVKDINNCIEDDWFKDSLFLKKFIKGINLEYQDDLVDNGIGYVDDIEIPNDILEDRIFEELELYDYDKYFNSGKIDCIIMENIKDGFRFFDNDVATNYAVLDDSIIKKVEN